jgi:16S rRNA (guanine966-N2)-methyltransferase
MRIIGGALKGRQFHPPHLSPTRPTTDFGKEGLFNVINNNFNFENLRVLDLFGGTGSISYEFCSRGCTDVTTVEIFPKCVSFIRKTASDFRFTGIKIMQLDIFKYIESKPAPFDVIFAGPPYPLPNLATIPDLIFEQQLLIGDGWLILEHNPDHNFEQHPHFYRSKSYGTTTFAVFTNQGKEAQVV